MVHKWAIWTMGVLTLASVGVAGAPVARAGTTGKVAEVRTAVAADTAAGNAAGVDAAAQAQAELNGDITFSVPSGTFQGELSVGLSTSVANAEIRYTTDGQLPGATSTRYSGTPLRLTGTTQLRAQAFAGGAATGAPGTALYLARSLDATPSSTAWAATWGYRHRGSPLSSTT